MSHNLDLVFSILVLFVFCLTFHLFPLFLTGMGFHSVLSMAQLFNTVKSLLLIQRQRPLGPPGGPRTLHWEPVSKA